MHGVTGIDDLDNFLGAAVDQGDLTRITQGDRKQVIKIKFVFLFGRSLIDSHNNLTRILCFFHDP